MVKKKSFAEWTRERQGITTDTRVVAPTAEDLAEEDSWLKAGAFADDEGDWLTDTLASVGSTIGDVASGVAQGILGLGEGVLDLGTHILSGAAGLVGWEDGKNALRDAAQYGIVENAFNPIDDLFDENSFLGNKTEGIEEGLGQVAAIMLTGGAAAAGGFSATAATTGMTLASSWGSGINEAYAGGATDAEAWGYGAISGLVDAGTELLFGGLGKTVKAVGLSKGISSLDDMFAKKLSSKISSTFAKNLVQFGVKSAAEGVEEVLAGIGSAIGKKMTYMSEEDLGKLIEDENLLEQFVVGSVTAGISQSGLVPGMKKGSLIDTTKKGVDFVTNLSQNEQKVVDKEVEKRVGEKEKRSGKELTNKEKNAIYDQVIEDLDNGAISIDTIEEVLGGDSYKAYQDAVASDKALIDEYEELGKKQGATLAEQERFRELHGQMKDIKADTRYDELKGKLTQSAFDTVKADRKGEGSRLLSSYAEVSKRGKAFEADVNSYDEKYRATVQRAIDSGILNNSRRTHEFVEILAKIEADKGVKFDFLNNEKLKGTSFARDDAFVNGYYDSKSKTIGVNIDSAKAWQTTVGHEVTHVLEGTELYADLQKALFEYAEAKGELKTRREALAKLYGEKDIDSELAADLVGDYLFTDKNFITNLSKNKKLFQRVFDEIKYLWKIATAGSKEKRQLEEIKHLFEQVYKADVKANKDTANFSLSEQKTPTYEELVAKEPTQIISVTEGIESGTYAEMKKAALDKATAEGWFDTPHHNADTDSLIFLTEKSFTHAYSNLTADFGEDTIRCMAHIPEIIKEAVLVNVADPKDSRKLETKVYTFLGAVEGVNGVEPVKLTVKEFDFKSLKDVPKNIRSYFEKNGIMQSYNSLYDAHALEVIGIEGIKKESDASGKVGGQSPRAQATSNSTISIADLLNLVKGDAEKYIPQKAKFSLSSNNTNMNGAEYNGKEFWIGVADLNGNIVQTWTYEEAESRGFDLDMDAIFNDKLKDGYRFFTTDLIEDNGRIEFDDYGDRLPDNMIERINEQIKVKPTTKPAANIDTATLMEYLNESLRYSDSGSQYKDVRSWVEGEGARSVAEDLLLDHATEYGSNIPAHKWVDALFESGLDEDAVLERVEMTINESVNSGTKYSLSPEQQKADADYLAAVERGDIETAQRMVDEAAWQAGYRSHSMRDGSPSKVFHGTSAKFTVFSHDAKTVHGKYFGKGFYFTDSKNAAEFFAGKGTYYYNPETADFDLEKEAYVMGVYLDMGKCVSVNAQHFKNMGELERVIYDAFDKNPDRDGLIVYNIKDGTDDLSTVYVVKNANQIKSADPITYDDNGNVIPLSQRFNVENDDIRYSLSSMASTFFGDENMSALAFKEADYTKTQGYKDYVEKCVNNMRQTRTDFDETTARKQIEDSIDGIVRVALAAKQAGYDIYDDASKRDKKDSKNRLLFSSLEPNSDYFTSNDISTICDKRKNFAEIYDDIVRAEEAKGVPQGKRFFDNVDNYFYLHKLMADKGLTQPCRQCYVESMRKNLAPMANAFLRLVGETDPNNTANDQLYEQKGKNKGNLKSNNAATREWVLEKLSEYGMTAADLSVETLTTEDGLAQLKIQAPLIYEAFNSFYGQSKPKMPKSATPFRFGELTALLTDNKGNIKQSLVDKINSTGGFRLQSYSDFQIQNYTDVLQVIFEAGTLGLNGHAYTKVPAFLEATEGTNLKRNISIFMYKDGNEWKLDRNDSFPYTLEEIYDIVNGDKSGNTSIIAVSQNNEMSAWIMANDLVGYGIPFHKSGMKMGTVRDTDVKTEDGRIVKGYADTKDHTKQQTEVWATTTADHKAYTKVKKGINIYGEEVGWDFENKGNLSKNELIEKNIKAYIDACEKAGYIPKFRDYVMNNGKVLTDVLKYAKELGFASPDATIADISFEYKGYTIPYGYYKFLGDFGMFTPDGQTAPQKPLSLENYDFDKAVEFFGNSEELHRNEILQQFANGKEREIYRNSDLTAEQLTEIIKQRRTEIADNVVSGQASLSPIGETPTQYGDFYTPANEMRFEAPTAEDIAPVGVAENAITTPTVSKMEQVAPTAKDEWVSKDIAPVAENAPKEDEGSESFVGDGSQVAKVLEEEPEVPKEERKILNKIRANFVDKGSVVEDLALKTGNRELDAKYNFMHYSESRAQSYIAKHLKPIVDAVEKTGKQNEFETYAYHLHNIDRMSLESKAQERIAELKGKFGLLRIDQIKAIAATKITEKTTERTAQTIREAKEYLKALETKNKPVYGDSVTADVSREEVKRLEAENPEFKELVKAYTEYNNALRKMLVDGGVISQQTADLWAQMYPHYMPIRRDGKSKLGITVPLDTNKTGVNAPIKQATGGNSDILPLRNTMAIRTEQTFKAIARNSFGIELMRTLDNSVVESESASVDEVMDGFENHDELLKEGKRGQNPTFTVFENGQRVTFEISEDMYDALKPTSKALSHTFKVASKLNNLRRGLITEYNPAFMLTNPIKDAQDVLMNSQHARLTYKNFPKAIAELWTKGKWYTEYMENGGEDNTYFDGKTNKFAEDAKGIKKLIGIPLNKISDANNFIERIPRLAEYIASRESGASIESAMLDAARVTTNFAAGGDVTKMLNRNGATFLNASVQGAAQQIRNLREAKAKGLKGVMHLAAKFAVAGLPAVLLNHLLWGDDEEYEDLSDYVKDNYYIVAKYGDGQFVRIPKGRTLAVIQDAFEQMGNMLTGNDEVDLANFLELAISNLAPNNPLENNIIAPIDQAIRNKTWYGEDLVPTRLQDLPEAEQFDESTDALSKWLGETLNISPYKINYVLDQYSGAIGDIFLPMMTPEADGGGILAPLADKFTTDSVLNNQNVADFYDKVDELTKYANSSKATDADVLASKYMNSVNAELGELYKTKREIQNSDLPDNEKYAAIRELQAEINALAKESLNAYGNVKVIDGYASVGDRYYKQGDDGKWTKLTDTQVAKLGNVVTALNEASSTTYWRGKSESDFASSSPGQYAVAKSIGGYEAYKSYSTALDGIKADTISSRKQKVIDYINNLDADYGTKILLFKNEYKSDDTYNYDIIEYLNSRKDITYKDMEAILKELGFHVDEEGNIYWY